MTSKTAAKFLYIVIDQLRADCLVGALSSSVRMPNLRALMNESVTFTQHHTVTNPCGPAQASLHTGRYAMNHGSVRNGTPLAASFPNIATEARKAGYEPLLFGYTDTSADPVGRHPDDPDLTGYDRVLPGFSAIVQVGSNANYAWRADLKAK